MKGKTNVANDTMHECLKNILTVAQFFGAFPLENLRNASPEKVQFRWFSWKMCYTILLAFGYLLCGLMSLHKAVSNGTIINQLISPLFYINLFVTTVILIEITTKWGGFIVEVCKLEQEIFRKYPSHINLKRKINVIATIVFTVALIEHSFATLNYIYSKTCQNYAGGWEYYFKKQFHYIFHYFTYHFVYGFLLLILSWFGTFTWNLGDTLIILISTIVSTRLKQISHTLQEHMKNNGCPVANISQGKFIKVYNSKNYLNLDEKFWREIREDYDKFTHLCRFLDSILANLITFSYAYNLSFILIQLFNSLRLMDSFIERLYFFFSFGFVIVRTIAVSVYGASIYDECKAFLPILNSVPTELYNVEIQRFTTEIHVDSVALTGHNFFKITRGLVLNVAAAIITYELVLIQFNQATLEKFMTANSTICY